MVKPTDGATIYALGNVRVSDEEPRCSNCQHWEEIKDREELKGYGECGSENILNAWHEDDEELQKKVNLPTVIVYPDGYYNLVTSPSFCCPLHELKGVG